MKISEIKAMSTSALQEKLRKQKEELFNLRFRHAIGQLENPSSINACKKNIARVMTILREKEAAKA